MRVHRLAPVARKHSSVRLCSTRTKPLWLSNTYLFTAPASVVGISELGDSEGSWGLTLDATPFHPQGGGQPSDTGVVRSDTHTWAVIGARMDQQSQVVHHGVPGVPPPFQVGELIHCEINQAERLRASRVHSAGHLIDVAMGSCGCQLRPTKGFHFTSGAYVEYAGLLSVEERNDLRPRLQAAIDSLVTDAIPTEVFTVPAHELGEYCAEDTLATNYKDGGSEHVRLVNVGGVCCPCGGTHVADTAQIGKVTVKSIKKKGKSMRVSYTVSDV